MVPGVDDDSPAAAAATTGQQQQQQDDVVLQVAPIPAWLAEEGGVNPYKSELEDANKKAMAAMGKAEEAKGGRKGRRGATGPILPYTSLFRYADAWDVFLIVEGLICAGAHGVLMPVMNLFLGEAIDVFGKNTGDLVAGVRAVALKLVWCGLAAGFTTFFQYLCLSTSAERQAYRIRTKYFQATLIQEMGWHDFHQSGEVTTRLASDMQTIQESMGDKLGEFVQFTCTLISGFAIGISKGWRMGLVMTAVMPLFIGAGAALGISMGILTAKGQAAYNLAGTLAEETISCVRTVISFGGEQRVANEFNKRLEKSRDYGILTGRALGICLSLMFFFMFGSYSLAFWYGSQLLLQGKMTAGDVISVFLSVLLGAQSVSQMMQPLSTMSMGRGSAYNIFATIERMPLIDPVTRKGTRLESAMGEIEFKDVCFSYPTRPTIPILNKFSLLIPPGKTMALVGRSGCGKSTVVGLIERFYTPKAGQVTLGGTDISELNLRWLRNQIGIVSQEPILFATTIAENIAYGKDVATEDEIIAAAKAANAHTFISELPQGYQTLVGERGVQLSGGQKQRIAIARALIRNPSILLLDEATSALDNQSEKIVQEALTAAAVSRTTIVIAHRLTTIRNADCIAVVDAGRVIERGTHDELMEKHGEYYALVMRQELQKAEEEKSLEPALSPSPVPESEMVPVPSSSVSRVQQESTTSRTESKQAALEEKQAQDATMGEVVGLWGAMSRAVLMIKDKTLLMITGCLWSAINGAVFPLFSLLFSNITGYLVMPTDLNKQSKLYAVWFVLLAFGIAISAFLHIYPLFLAGQHLTFRMRKSIFSTILRQEVGWFDQRENRAGMLATRIAKDGQVIQAMAGTTVGSILNIIGTLIAGLLISFIACWKLALVVLVCVPLIFGGILLSSLTQIVGKSSASFSRKATEASGSISAEALESIRTVVSLGLERVFALSFRKQMKEPKKSGMLAGTGVAIGLGVAEMSVFMTWALAFWYGSKLVGQGEATFTDMMKAIMGITFGAVHLGHLVSHMQSFSKAKLAMKEFCKMLDRTPRIDVEKKGTVPAGDIKGLMHFKDISFRYPTRPEVTVLRHFSLTVEPNTTVALVGPSGSGKSTIVGLVERFYEPYRGSVELDGKDIKDLDLKWLRSQIGYVGQEPVLFAMSIEENIRYGKEGASLEEVVEAAKKANAHSFISALPNGYNTNVGEKGTQLSGGQKQRIAIARALIRNPSILILDEATSALDTESERIVQDALDRARMGRTTIVIAHRLSTIKDADSIAVLSGGKITEQGTHSQLMAMRGLYYTLATQQVDGM